MELNIMTSYVSDELSNKVKHLHSALLEAQNIIIQLEKENIRLNNALVSLACLNNEDYVLSSESINESVYTV